MELSLKHYGNGGGRPSNIIELKVISNNTIIEEDITDRNSKVDENFIMVLREIADELEEHNKLLAEYK